ncbi:hypothetical protein RhiirC2_864066 [Rhizophagus irregularis]|uniref:Uncharacterized protein n=1 Tax=Rhizophagus irregularis TaxID=588596 RepID=A0A2N1NJM0_9GLOM|nr:hypothetical protein RhiirC2_864066 [Rhizophagus irregularis]
MRFAEIYSMFGIKGTVCDTTLPEGLKEGQSFEKALYTPSTKAEIGQKFRVLYQAIEVTDVRGIGATAVKNAILENLDSKEQKTVLKFPAAPAPSFKHVSVIKAADEHGIVLMHTNLRLLI